MFRAAIFFIVLAVVSVCTPSYAANYCNLFTSCYDDPSSDLEVGLVFYNGRAYMMLLADTDPITNPTSQRYTLTKWQTNAVPYYVGEGSCSNSLVGTTVNINSACNYSTASIRLTAVAPSYPSPANAYQMSVTGSGNYYTMATVKSNTTGQTTTYRCDMVGTASAQCYSVVAPVVSITCPQSLHIGESGQCTSSVNDPSGTPSYLWTVGGITATTSTFNLTGAGTAGTNMNVDFKVCSKIDSTLCTTVNKSVSLVASPTLTIDTATCSTTNSDISCTASASASSGGVTYQWKDETGAVRGNSAAINYAAAVGNHVLTVTATSTEYSPVTASRAVNVSVQASVTSTTLTCPDNLVPGESGSCSVTAVTSDGSATTSSWTVRGISAGLGNTLDVMMGAGDANGIDVSVTSCIVNGGVCGNATVKHISVLPVSQVSLMLTGPSEVRKDAMGNYFASYTVSSLAEQTIPMQYNWTFPDGVVAAGSSVTHIYAAPISGQVKVAAVRVSTPNSVVSSASMLAKVGPSILGAALDCPFETLPNNSVICVAKGDASYGTLRFIWTTDGGVIVPDPADSKKASVTFSVSDIGSRTVSLLVASDEDARIAELKSVNINISAPSVKIETLTCPTSIAVGNDAVCTTSVTSTAGDVTYTWAVDDVAVNDTLIAHNGSSDHGIKFPVVATGQKVITLTASSGQYSDTKTALVRVTYVSPTINQLVCTPEVFLGQQVSCTLDATAPAGTLMVNWSASSGSLSDPDAPQDGNVHIPVGKKANVMFSASGDETVDVKVSLVEDSISTVSTRATVKVVREIINASLSCEATTVWTNAPVKCTATAATTWGTLGYKWSSMGGTFVADQHSASASFLFTKPGSGAITVKPYVVEAPNVSISKTVNIKVNGYKKPVIQFSKPKVCYRGVNQSVTLKADVISPSGPVDITWALSDVANTQTGDEAVFQCDDFVSHLLTITAMIQNAGDDPNSKSSITQKLLVQTPQPPRVILPDPDRIYADTSLTLTAKVNSDKIISDIHPVVARWVLPDGTFDVSGPAITKTFPAPGEYQYTFEAWYQNLPELTDRKTVTVKVIPYVMPEFEIIKTGRGLSNAPEVPITVKFTAQPSSRMKIDDLSLQFAWRFNDGIGDKVTAENTITRTFDVAGEYVLDLTVTDSTGETKTAKTLLNLAPTTPLTASLSATFSNKFMRVPLSVTINSGFSGGGGNPIISLYQWSIDGQIVSTASRLQYSFSQPGNYLVSLEAVSSSGVVTHSEERISVVANKLPVCTIAERQYKSGVTPIVDASAVCTDTDGSIGTCKWRVFNKPFANISPDELKSRNNIACTGHSCKRQVVSGETYTFVLTAFDDSYDSIVVTKEVVAQ